MISFVYSFVGRKKHVANAAVDDRFDDADFAITPEISPLKIYQVK